MSLLVATFNDGTSNGFRPVNHPGSVTMNVMTYAAGDHGSGTGFLRASTTQVGGSVAVDLTFFSNAALPLGVTAFAWVRSRGGPLQGLLTIWELTSGVTNHFDTQFTAGADWHLINNALITLTTANPISANNTLTFRLEFYLNTIGQNLDIDTAVLL
jgi:hypothetical protein